MKLVKYSTEWCQPCKVFTPIARKVTAELGIPFEEVDVTNKPVPGITSVPTSRVVDDEGNVLGEKVGAMRVNDLREWLQSFN